MTTEFSRHHIPCHKSKCQWRSSEAGRQITGTPSLIPQIEIATHEEINKVCPMVPVLGLNTLIAVAREFEPVGDTFKDLDMLLACIERASEHPRSDISEKVVAQMAIHAIRLQVPVLRSGGILKCPRD